MKSKKRIAVIIAIHNRLEFTKRCLESLYKKSDLAEIDTFIVDDGSTDGSSEWIKKNYSNIQIIKGDGNLWFGRAINIGIKKAFDYYSKYDYFFIINNDTFLVDGAIDDMIKASNGAFVVGSYYYIEDLCQESTGGFIWNNLKGLEGISYSKNWEKLKSNHQYVFVDSVSCTCSLYPTKYIKNFMRINIEIHPHNRYDVMLAAICKKEGAKFKVSTDILAIHNFCKDDRIKKKWYDHSFKSYFNDLFLDPLQTSYLLGLLHSNIAIAPKFYSTLFVNFKLIIYSFIKLSFLIFKPFYKYFKK